MSNTIKLKATDGTEVEFVDEVCGSGAMKDVYFSPDKSYVVGFFRNPLDMAGKQRLENITGLYKDKIFKETGGDYWKSLMCWPTKMVEWNGKVGIVCPTYDKDFFFNGGRFNGKEKEGKWFASAKLRNKFLTPQEKGDWLKSLQVCIRIARAVRRLHAAGLAHSDLSYKNVLVDPEHGKACIIDIDGLVVPGKFPPDVVGTPDFIAPEVMETQKLDKKDPNRVFPSISTDRHALAVLIYMYLFYRHPLKGGKINDATDSTKDEELSMGKNALFVEHPTDKSNRPKDLDKCELPQGDVDKLPYTLCGPYLKELFDQAFIDGLHNPQKRPTAQQWEEALVKTTDLVQPCQNPNCESKWFVFDNKLKPRCPFCGTEYHGMLPVLDFYYSPRPGNFIPDNSRLMVYHQQSLYLWHVNRFKAPNEKLNDTEKRPVGDFHLLNGKWVLINRKLESMYEIKSDGTKQKIEIGKYVELNNGTKILLSTEDGGRLVVVSMVNN